MFMSLKWTFLGELEHMLGEWANYTWGDYILCDSVFGEIHIKISCERGRS